jgi:hypothetical protein
MVKQALENSEVQFKICLNHAIDELSSKDFTILNKEQILSFVLKYSIDKLQQNPQIIPIIRAICTIYPELKSDSPINYTE